MQIGLRNQKASRLSIELTRFKYSMRWFNQNGGSLETKCISTMKFMLNYLGELNYGIFIETDW